ncbi:hypothetical protein Plo01_16460 [Planobispora longispora]|uniref:Uncharacterized protein n=2 Tax=Planobispora longispora TaxID=28887 RepID=A0A8J3RGD8_9ACTN|nr:hypothetical protein Plo01_16460 [Planobispora longispora]
MAVLGGILALYMVFGLVLPALFGLFKFLFVLAMVAFLVVLVVTVAAKFSKSVK